MRNVFRDERGVALITAVIVMFVVVSMATAIVTLAAHNSQQSASNRRRIQAVAAAEAGLNHAYALVETSSPGTLRCTTGAHTVTSAPQTSTFEATLTYYDQSGMALPSTICNNPTNTVLPAKALIESLGRTGQTIQRKMESEVNLTPIFGLLNLAIFADASLTLPNQMEIHENQPGDADIYTNGDLTITNNVDVQGSLFAQGSISLGGKGVIKRNVWANSWVDISGQREVQGNVTSSTSSISVSSPAQVIGDSTAGTTISGGDRAGELQLENSPQGPPPRNSLPQLTFEASDWEAEGYTVHPPFGDCALAKAFIETLASGRHVVQINAVCELGWGNNSTINVRGDLAIVTNGSITTSNKVDFNGIGGEWDLHLIDLYRPALDCPSGDYDIGVSNKTTFNNLRVFAYSPCTVSFSNNQSGGSVGQIIGRSVNINNNFKFTYKPIFVPGATIVGFEQDIRFTREVRV